MITDCVESLLYTLKIRKNGEKPEKEIIKQAVT